MRARRRRRRPPSSRTQSTASSSASSTRSYPSRPGGAHTDHDAAAELLGAAVRDALLVWKAWISTSGAGRDTENSAIWGCFWSNRAVSAASTASTGFSPFFANPLHMVCQGLEAGIATGPKCQPPLVGREVAKEPLAVVLPAVCVNPDRSKRPAEGMLGAWRGSANTSASGTGRRPRSRSGAASAGNSRSSSSSATMRAGCTTTSGSSATARSRAGRSRRAFRSSPGSGISPSMSRTTRSTTPTFEGEIPKG